MNLQEVWALGFSSQLSHCLNEGHALNVTNCTTQLDYAHVRLFIGVIDWDLSDPLDPFYNSVCDVWDDLNSLAKVVALPLASDDVLIDFAGGDVVLAGQSDVQVAFVVAQVEIDLSAIVEYEDLPMSEG